MVSAFEFDSLRAVSSPTPSGPLEADGLSIEVEAETEVEREDRY